MANKRNLKKQIRYICGEIALECVLARECVEGIESKDMNGIIVKVAELQEKSLGNVSFSFDKAPRDFASVNLYRKAASKYYKSAYKAFYDEFNKQIQSIVKEMNALLPAKQREINKEIAKA